MLKVDVTSWQQQIRAHSAIINLSSEKVFARSVDLLKKRIIEYTPVGDPTLWHWPAHKDYTPGFLKSNWKAVINGQEAEISNDAPYALRVENGWSSQAPNGMMRRAWMDYPIILEQAAREFKS